MLFAVYEAITDCDFQLGEFPHVVTLAMEVRDAKYNFEKRLAQESKDNPKFFYSHCRSKTFIKEKVTQLQGKDVTLTITSKEACELLNEEFHGVYHGEEYNFPETTYYF